MSDILLDTSGYSAFKRGHPGIREVIRSAETILLTPVVLGELYAGFRQGRRETANREQLHEFLNSPRVKLADIGRETSERYAEIFTYLRGQGTPIPTNDIWIAATAMEYGVRVVGTDTHYKKIPHILTEIFGG
jgi:predicted nucleic acid-binding protein